MRVFYDHQAFSLQDAGGITRYHFELLRYMRSQADVMVNTVIGINGSVLPLESLASHRVRIRSIRMGMGPGIARYALNEAISTFVTATVGTQDIYHSTYHRFMPIVRAKKKISTHHDCVQERYPELFPDAGRNLRRKRRLFALSDTIICVSESSRRDLIEFYGIDASRTKVIHHGLNVLPRCSNSALELKRIAKREYILTVGSRAAYKNFRSLLQAYAETGLHKCFDLLVVGGGLLTKEELASVTDLGLTEAIRLVPLASDCFLAEAYASAQLFVYPSLYEGFGFPPLEAMSVGCPVVVSNRSSLPEVCGDAAFYFDPSEPGSLARIMQLAIQNSELRETAIKRGKNVSASYSWERCGRETLEVYLQ